MTDSPQPRETLNIGFVPGSTWVAAMEVDHFAPGSTVELDPDRKAYPKPFSQAKPGTYQIMALLDPNHTYSYHGQDEGDLSSAVVKVENLNPAAHAPVELTLSRVTPARFKPTDTENVKLVEFQSPMLTAFHGRAITMRAGVVLPPGYGTDAKKFYPTVYHVHGFGGDHTAAWRQGQQLTREIGEGKSAEMLHVYLDGSCPGGHHEFADSVNNGPWGRALTEEFIPHFEKKFRAVAKPYARFLTGHSSGGWSTLWLQVTYPDFFGGTWSTAPDPVDLRNFTGIDATPGSKDNAYRRPDGTPKNLVRQGGRDLVTLEEFARQEEVLGEYGGQFASFEWVWSPRGADGRPMKAFNRETGELNQEVLKYWQNYDIRLILERNWAKLGPRLKGKINVICGDADTFHLNEAVVMLCDFFKQKGSDAVCELVPGRDHGNLYQPEPQHYPEGLAARINKEMQAKYEQAAKGEVRTAKARR
ncbi:MAG TPA: alpha/beta hydrolase [Blastocatellia bacterium]|nr:alpha/beta hydrolase [Blastocatellia bacterium]